jgi:2-polyprenyl-3-methyl-5-hydroxy-6-metoxy-1,4-benzoquinol methylase
VFLTEPQSSHFDAAKFQGLSPRENHFDWSLYYRFKDQRERFWRQRMEADEAFRGQAAEHFAAFQRSIEVTIRLLEPVHGPCVLDVGLSSEQLDRAILTRTRGQVAVLDIEIEAARSYDRAFGGRGSFILGDVITFARDAGTADRYDLVYSIGLIEHFPDKADIIGAHVRLVKPGGLMLLYVPIDTAANRLLTGLAAEWENFGYRELMTSEELCHVCTRPDLDVVRVETVGFFGAVWARKHVNPR